MVKQTEKELPRLSDVEKTIDNLSYNISDICIDYFNKGIEKGHSTAIQQVLEIIKEKKIEIGLVEKKFGDSFTSKILDEIIQALQAKEVQKK